MNFALIFASIFVLALSVNSLRSSKKLQPMAIQGYYDQQTQYSQNGNNYQAQIAAKQNLCDEIPEAHYRQSDFVRISNIKRQADQYYLAFSMLEPFNPFYLETCSYIYYSANNLTNSKWETWKKLNYCVIVYDYERRVLQVVKKILQWNGEYMVPIYGNCMDHQGSYGNETKVYVKASQYDTSSVKNYTKFLFSTFSLDKLGYKEINCNFRYNLLQYIKGQSQNDKRVLKNYGYLSQWGISLDEVGGACEAH